MGNLSNKHCVLTRLSIINIWQYISIYRGSLIVIRSLSPWRTVVLVFLLFLAACTSDALLSNDLSANELYPSQESKVLESPRGSRPETAYTLVESNPELKQLIQDIPTPEIRKNLINSIAQTMKNNQYAEASRGMRADGDIIAVGKIEMPDGARTLQDGAPQGGALILQGGQRKLNFVAPGFTMNGTVYSGKESIRSSHWPWYVTSLKSGKTSTLKCLTLQHKEAVIQASNENHNHGIALPTAKLGTLTKKDAFTASTSVTCNGRPFPAHASLALPGYTNEALRLRVDFDDGKLRIHIPKIVFAAGIPISMLIENEYCFTRNVKVAKPDSSRDAFTLPPVELRLKRESVLNVLTTNSDTLDSENRSSFELDADRIDPSRDRIFYMNRGYRLTANQSKKGVSISVSSMVKFADLGKKLPKRAVDSPVPRWFDESKLQTGGKVLLVPEHYYLIKLANLEKEDAARWGMVRIDSPVSKIDNRVAQKGDLGPNLRETMIRLGRFRNFFGFSYMIRGGFNVNAPINDADVKLLTTLKSNVFIHLDNNHQLTLKGLKNIAAADNVQSIRFRRLNMTTTMFRQLKTIQSSNLRFDFCNVSCGKQMISSKSLSSAEFNYSDVDPRVISALSKCVQLKTVTFNNCTGLTGNEQLFAQLPPSVTSIKLKNCQVDPKLRAALLNQRGQLCNVDITDNQ